jgi:hypothetical protein
MTDRHLPKGALERTETDEQVIRRLVEQIDRTYETDGRASALQAVTDMLRRLDSATIQALGVEREVDAEELERER